MPVDEEKVKKYLEMVSAQLSTLTNTRQDVSSTYKENGISVDLFYNKQEKQITVTWLTEDADTRNELLRILRSTTLMHTTEAENNIQLNISVDNKRSVEGWLENKFTLQSQKIVELQEENLEQEQDKEEKPEELPIQNDNQQTAAIIDAIIQCYYTKQEIKIGDFSVSPGLFFSSGGEPRIVLTGSLAQDNIFQTRVASLTQCKYLPFNREIGFEEADRFVVFAQLLAWKAELLGDAEYSQESIHQTLDDVQQSLLSIAELLEESDGQLHVFQKDVTIRSAEHQGEKSFFYQENIAEKTHNQLTIARIDRQKYAVSAKKAYAEGGTECQISIQYRGASKLFVYFLENELSSLARKAKLTNFELKIEEKEGVVTCYLSLKKDFSSDDYNRLKNWMENNIVPADVNSSPVMSEPKLDTHNEAAFPLEVNANVAEETSAQSMHEEKQEIDQILKQDEQIEELETDEEKKVSDDSDQSENKHSDNEVNDIDEPCAEDHSLFSLQENKKHDQDEKASESNNCFPIHYSGNDKKIKSAIDAINEKNNQLNTECTRWTARAQAACRTVKTAQKTLLTTLVEILNDARNENKASAIATAATTFETAYGAALKDIQRRDRKAAMKWGAGWGVVAAVVVLAAIFVPPVAFGMAGIGVMSVLFSTPVCAALATVGATLLAGVGAGALAAVGTYMKRARTGVRGTARDLKNIVHMKAAELGNTKAAFFQNSSGKNERDIGQTPQNPKTSNHN